MGVEHFTDGRQCKAVYYPSRLPAGLVIQNAYAMSGSRYDLVRWNCEHFANACHGLPAISKQVNTVAVVAALTGLAVAFAKAA